MCLAAVRCQYLPDTLGTDKAGCAILMTDRAKPGRTAPAIKGRVLGWAISALLVLTTIPAIAQTAPDPVVTIALHPDMARKGPAFEGWGTALAWFANVTGAWPDGERQRLADLLYGPGGLGWTIARYNIGGGNPPDIAPYLRPGAAVPGFWRQPTGATGGQWWDPDDPQNWDWQADASQRWWLDAINALVEHPIFEAFSNAPPWFMTVSGRVSGAQKGTDDNLLPGHEPAFATYLARVVKELEQRHHIHFRTLSPVNEPNTDYWFAANTQEGTHWNPARQAAMIDATDAALRREGLTTVVSAPDETNSHLFEQDWRAYPAATRARIGQLNVHSYGTVHQTAVRDIARSSGIRLWMSENDAPLPEDPEDFSTMISPLAFAEHVVLDLKRLEPVAWVFWQAVEDLTARDDKPGSNWGLIKTDFRAPAQGPHQWYVTRKYWVMAQFSRYIRPGDRMIPVDDLDSVAALSPDGKRMVIVHVNPGLSSRHLLPPAGWRMALVVTDATREAACLAGTTVPPRAVATLILTKGTGQAPCPQ